MQPLQFPHQSDKGTQDKERNMKAWWVMLALLVLATALTATAEPSQQSANAQALNRWLGSWKSHTVLKPAAWSLKAQELSGTSKSLWILDGRFSRRPAGAANMRRVRFIAMTPAAISFTSGHSIPTARTASGLAVGTKNPQHDVEVRRFRRWHRRKNCGSLHQRWEIPIDAHLEGPHRQCAPGYSI